MDLLYRKQPLCQLSHRNCPNNIIIIESAQTLIFFIWTFPSHFFIQTLQFLQQINVKKCPSSIWWWDSKPRPSKYESPPITTKPHSCPEQNLSPGFWSTLVCFLHPAAFHLLQKHVFSSCVSRQNFEYFSSSSNRQCYKTFFWTKSKFPPRLRHWKMFVLMYEPALKCKSNAIFKQNYTLKLLIDF